MNTEKIKRIAEGLYPDTKQAILGRGTPDERVKIAGLYRDFNPYESDADAFKVLEALREELKNGDVERKLIITENDLILATFRGSITWSLLIHDLKTAICEAYLAARGEG